MNEGKAPPQATTSVRRIWQGADLRLVIQVVTLVIAASAAIWVVFEKERAVRRLDDPAYRARLEQVVVETVVRAQLFDTDAIATSSDREIRGLREDLAELRASLDTANRRLDELYRLLLAERRSREGS